MASSAAADPTGPPSDLVGLALSGGGIRGATFSLGVVQALGAAGLLPLVDYLSTVSGGGFLGGAVSALLSTPDAGPQPGRFPLGGPTGRPEPPAARHLRHSSHYLAPGGLLDRIRLAEDLAREITPPTRPADVLGPIDTALAAEGESIFRATCATCHEGDEPGSSPGDKQYALDVIGTDPERITTFGTPLDGQPFAVVFPPVLDKFIDWSMDNEEIDEAEAKRLIGPEPEWRETNKYGTRALHGSWATAPYLHNGSVPTLYDLLRPAAERPMSFPIGSREYDVVKLGLTIEGVDGWMFDVAKDGAPIAGNSNAGHEGAAFGTELSEEERMALLEFLKGY